MCDDSFPSTGTFAFFMLYCTVYYRDILTKKKLLRLLLLMIDLVQSKVRHNFLNF
jgi:hypothetical protein